MKEKLELEAKEKLVKERAGRIEAMDKVVFEDHSCVTRDDLIGTREGEYNDLSIGVLVGPIQSKFDCPKSRNGSHFCRRSTEFIRLRSQHF